MNQILEALGAGPCLRRVPDTSTRRTWRKPHEKCGSKSLVIHKMPQHNCKSLKSAFVDIFQGRLPPPCLKACRTVTSHAIQIVHSHRDRSVAWFTLKDNRLCERINCAGASSWARAVARSTAATGEYVNLRLIEDTKQKRDQQEIVNDGCRRNDGKINGQSGANKLLCIVQIDTQYTLLASKYRYRLCGP